MAFKLKTQYERHEGDMMEFLRKENQKQFYKHFRKRKSKAVKGNITSYQFLKHFLKVSTPPMQTNVNIDSDFDSIQSSAYEELDAEITFDEV